MILFIIYMIVQVAKGLMVDTRDPSSKPSCFTFPAEFISKINEADTMLPFSQKKKKKLLFKNI